MEPQNVLQRLEEVTNRWYCSDEEGPFARQAMCEGSMCSMRMSGSYRGEHFQLRPLIHFVVHVMTDVRFSSKGSIKVGSAFCSDVYIRALETGICTGEMGIFGYQPSLGGIWVIPKGRPNGVEPVPPRSQMGQLTCGSSIISIP